ncbi:GNAT family N-acetyltransferase [Woodsholea maritima]|uniref:GNAT family N-acetyltransferase n=1 Tax=Woodsholea maritima TaxID=240237 RepID=UPI00036DAE46|nr:GNAT family N-acetyltransferase [Woodsholea maritima]
MIIETQRMILRRPEASDLEGFKALMQDEEAARFIGGVMIDELIWRQICMIIGHWEVHGFGFFTMIDKESGEWVGRGGPWFPLGYVHKEVGWSVARKFWRKGYASELAVACLDHVFDDLGWARVVHNIAPDNIASQRVAKKLGSYDTGEDLHMKGFDITVDLWGQTREEWQENRKRLVRG